MNSYIFEETVPEQDMNNNYTTLEEIFSNTSFNNIWLSSDWHIFKNHYKKEKNLVNTSEIISFCKENIKPNDVFMYLGDMCYRWANDEDNKKVQEIFKSLPGIKVLIKGNHDEMAGEEFYSNCGFDFVLNSFQYQNLIFSHRPVIMTLYPNDYLNIHGHIHQNKTYNDCDGSKNINVYPYYHNNQPVKLSKLLSHPDKYTKDNYWNNNVMLGESAMIDTTVSSLHELKVNVCNEGYDKLDGILNMIELEDINNNDL